MKIERPKQIGFTVTEQEHEEIMKLAASNGMTASAYIRMLIKRELEKGEEK